MIPSVPFLFVITFVCTFLGFLLGSLLMRDRVNKVASDHNDVLQDLALLKLARIGDGKFIKLLAAENETNRADAERYRLVRYYLEHDHGELAIEAFFGPQAIMTSDALDILLDEELDRRFVQFSDNA